MKDKIEEAIDQLVELSNKMEYTDDMRQVVQYLRDELHRNNTSYLSTFKTQGVSYVKVTLWHVTPKGGISSKPSYKKIQTLLRDVELKHSSSTLKVEGSTSVSEGRPGAVSYNITLRFTRPDKS
jgi:NAD-specific glutamate dehydrogenase